jgi:hypothetical protein
MPEQEYDVYRTMKGTQVYRVTARSRNDAVRQVLDGGGEGLTFEITEAARTATAYPVDVEVGGHGA